MLSRTDCAACLLLGFDGKGRLGPGAKLAATVGSLAPDCDLVIAGAGWDRYLHFHEAGTHTLLGVSSRRGRRRAMPACVPPQVTLRAVVVRRPARGACRPSGSRLDQRVGHDAARALLERSPGAASRGHGRRARDRHLRRGFRDQPAASQGSGVVYRGGADHVDCRQAADTADGPRGFRAPTRIGSGTDTGRASRRREWFDIPLDRLRARRGRSPRLDRGRTDRSPRRPVRTQDRPWPSASRPPLFPTFAPSSPSCICRSFGSSRSRAADL